MTSELCLAVHVVDCDRDNGPLYERYAVDASWTILCGTIIIIHYLQDSAVILG